MITFFGWCALCYIVHRILTSDQQEKLRKYRELCARAVMELEAANEFISTLELHIRGGMDEIPPPRPRPRPHTVGHGNVVHLNSKRKDLP